MEGPVNYARDCWDGLVYHSKMNILSYISRKSIGEIKCLKILKGYWQKKRGHLAVTNTTMKSPNENIKIIDTGTDGDLTNHPITLYPGDSICATATYLDGSKVSRTYDATRQVTINSIAFFEFENTFGMKNGIGAVFGERDE
jgi:hypothetical protein